MSIYLDKYQANKAIKRQLNGIVAACNHHGIPVTIIYGSDLATYSNMDQDEITKALT